MGRSVPDDIDALPHWARVWSEDTPVPPSVFDLLADAAPRKPWWQFW
jgi:hypothetical protein